MPNPEDFIELGRLDDGIEHDDIADDSDDDFQSNLDDVIAETQSELIDTLDDFNDDEVAESNLDDVIADTEADFDDTLDYDLSDDDSDDNSDSELSLDDVISDTQSEIADTFDDDFDSDSEDAAADDSDFGADVDADDY